MNFQTWFQIFVTEKGLDPEQVIVVEGPSGPNHMPLQIVFDAILSTAGAEQRGIKDVIVKIDFRNGDVVDFFRHLAQALAV